MQIIINQQFFLWFLVILPYTNKPILVKSSFILVFNIIVFILSSLQWLEQKRVPLLNMLYCLNTSMAAHYNDFKLRTHHPSEPERTPNDAHQCTAG